ncbi:MAG: hypothetical protein ACREV5_00595 [Steroidobacter sp.]
MCYEESFFRWWAKKKVQQHEESKPVVEHAAPPAQRGRPASIPTEAEKRKKVERELEIV